jgi:ABC-type siderophore export system fused ATPase/permease subunit
VAYAGSGKITLAMLLIGLFHPEQGEIKLNGIRIKDKDKDKDKDKENNHEAYLQSFTDKW